MNVVKEWIEAHPNLWEFIKFNILSNVATIVNFIVMWIGTATFTGFGWHQIPFQFLIFNFAFTISVSRLSISGASAASSCSVAACFSNSFANPFSKISLPTKNVVSSIRARMSFSLFFETD